MATVATDPANNALVVQIGGSYQDNTGATRDITLNFVYPENPDSTQKLPFTKREAMATNILAQMVASPVYESVQEEEVVYKAVKLADMLISTLNNVSIP